MAFRLLSVATLLVGAGFAVLFYIVMPMAWDARCSMEPCPELSASRRLMEASVPLVAAAVLVLVAGYIARRNQPLARVIVAAPVVLAIIWVTVLFGPLAG